MPLRGRFLQARDHHHEQPIVEQYIHHVDFRMLVAEYMRIGIHHHGEDSGELTSQIAMLVKYFGIPFGGIVHKVGVETRKACLKVSFDRKIGSLGISPC